MSAAVSQIGISTATVTLSLASMKRCSVSCRKRLSPTAGRTSAAARVAKFPFLGDDEVIAIYENGELRRSRAFAKEIVRTNFWNALKKVGKRGEPLVALVFAQADQFLTVIGEAINLTMIEFGRANGLGG